jgi:hypothetical protein
MFRTHSKITTILASRLALLMMRLLLQLVLRHWLSLQRYRIQVRDRGRKRTGRIGRKKGLVTGPRELEKRSTARREIGIGPSLVIGATESGTEVHIPMEAKGLEIGTEPNLGIA